MNIRFSKFIYVYYIFSSILIITSIISFVVFGLKFGIEFSGGSAIELKFSGERPTSENIHDQLKEFNLGDFSVQPV